jgi:hypothetical protein
MKILEWAAILVVATLALPFMLLYIVGVAIILLAGTIQQGLRS